MLQSRFLALFSLAIILILAVFLSCSPGGDGNEKEEDDGWPFDASGEILQQTPGLDGLALENRIDIEYKNGSAPVITNIFSEVSITANGENVSVMIPLSSNEEYSFVLSGTTSNGSLRFDGNVRKKLYLNGVNITSSKRPAINNQGNRHLLVHLVNGTQNYLTDSPNYETPGKEDAKGTFFSEGKLDFEGSGSLEVRAKYRHAIVVDEDFEMNNGKIIVSEAVNDGIHANDKIKVKGGILNVTSAGDAIQSEQDSIKIVGGKIIAKTTGVKSHGITSEKPISISGDAIIQISVLDEGSKGIRSRDYVEFDGGKTSIKTKGNRNIDNSATPPDTSTAAGIKSDTDLLIKGGELTIKSLGDKAKGINTDRDATIKAGNINVEADDDGIKVKGKLRIEGGTVNIKSRRKTAIDAGSYEKTGGDVTSVDGKF